NTRATDPGPRDEKTRAAPAAPRGSREKTEKGASENMLRENSPVPRPPESPSPAETVPAAPSESVERDAKEKAASVVLAWRGVDWEAVERGEPAAAAALRAASEAHESARRFLLDEAGELGRRLEAGLERFYLSDVAAQPPP